MISRKIVIIFSLGLGSSLLAQNRAPSCWLNYNDNFKGDLIVNSVRVANPSPLYTYYCTMQWNAGQEAGGYCGIQEHPDGRNFIFSIWDPIASNEPIRAAYTGAGTQTANFGGEGTGLRSLNFSIGWETNQWYTFVTRAWDYRSHTHFGYWVYDINNSVWHHLITMDFPVEGVRFNTGTGAFIEDWAGNGQYKRGVHQKNGWKRGYSSKNWRAFESARFSRVSPDAGAANYINKYNGGIAINAYYFMESGGSSSPVNNTSGTTLRLDNPSIRPEFAPIYLSDFEYRLNDQDLELDWEQVDSTAPQFSFTIELVNLSLSDSAVLSQTDTIPHLRNLQLDLSSYPVGDYKMRFHLTDIFDQESDTQEGLFSLGSSGVEDLHNENKSIWSIENNQLIVNLHNGSQCYRVHAMNGTLIHQGEDSDKLSMTHLPATFLLVIQDNKSGKTVLSQLFFNSGRR